MTGRFFALRRLLRRRELVVYINGQPAAFAPVRRRGGTVEFRVEPRPGAGWMSVCAVMGPRRRRGLLPAISGLRVAPAEVTIWQGGVVDA